MRDLHSKTLYSAKELLLLKLELLKKIDLFKALPEKTLKLLAEYSNDIVLEKEDLLFSEGDQTKNIKIYTILSGELLIYRGTQVRKQIAVLGAGQYVGEMAMIDSKPRSVTAVALNDVVLMGISQKVFNKYLASDSKALLEMMKVFSYRMRDDLDIMSNDMQKISNFTHDMRNCLTPLGIAEAHLDKLRNALNGSDSKHFKRDGEKSVDKSLKTILSVKNNLITLIDQSLACVKKTKKDYVKAELEIFPLIQETIEETSYHKYLKGKQISIHPEEGNIIKGFFNPLDIKRVFQNLIINAGYVTENNGAIKIYIKDLKGFNQVSIKDFGCGIPDKIKNSLLKENFTSKPDGNGFGLMSCREIIEDFHQGNIWFDTELNKGTTFYFTVPHYKGGQC